MSICASQELVDSSRLFGDPEALRARIAEDGYVFFRGLLDPVEIRSVGARFTWRTATTSINLRTGGKR